MPQAISASKIRKQRSPFYTRIFKDKSKAKIKSKKIWCLMVIHRLHAGEVKTRQFYKSRNEAKRAEELEKKKHLQEGQDSANLSNELRAEALQASKILGGRATLITAAEYYLAHAIPNEKATIGELVKVYLVFQESDGASPSYLADMKWRLERFASTFPKSKKVHEISSADIDKYLAKGFVRRGREDHPVKKAQKARKLSFKGRRNELRNLRTMFNYALDENYLKVSPIPEQKLLRRKSKDSHHKNKITVLTLDQVKEVLFQAGDLTPHIAVGLFAGLRPDETKALDWKHINWEDKRVAANQSDDSSHDRRVVDMSDNLIAWLTPYKKEKGLLSPPKLYRTRLEKLAKKTGLQPWPKDVLRHTFASYWLSKHKDEGKLKYLMGHHQSSHILRKHYLDLVKSEDADAFWDILP